MKFDYNPEQVEKDIVRLTELFGRNDIVPDKDLAVALTFMARAVLGEEFVTMIAIAMHGSKTIPYQEIEKRVRERT